MTRKRADVVFVQRGFAESRAKARAAIEAGGVRADGVPVAKPSDLIARGRADRLCSAASVGVARRRQTHACAGCVWHRSWRVALALTSAPQPAASPQVLLARGAARVYAVDVGSAQLHASLRDSPRVISFENTDARALTRAQIPAAPSLIVCDASFIGAAKVLATPLTLAAERADLIVLIKPQFEAGPGHGGVSQRKGRARRGARRH